MYVGPAVKEFLLTRLRLLQSRFPCIEALRAGYHFWLHWYFCFVYYSAFSLIRLISHSLLIPGAGADFVMLGGMFAGHDQCAGEVLEKNGKKVKLFYGMSSDMAMKKHAGGVAEYRYRLYSHFLWA